MYTYVCMCIFPIQYVYTNRAHCTVYDKSKSRGYNAYNNSRNNGYGYPYPYIGVYMYMYMDVSTNNIE